MKKIFFDTETTGYAPGNIAQLSAIVEEEGKDLRAVNYFFDIDYISEGAEQACGRGLDFYKKASKGLRFKDYCTELLELFSEATLIAHNEKFDENFLSTEFWRLGVIYKPLNRFCTMEYFKPIMQLPGKGSYKYKNPKLEELVDFYNLDKEKIKTYSDKLFGDIGKFGFHDARYDTTSMFVAFQVYRESTFGHNDWLNTFGKR